MSFLDADKINKFRDKISSEDFYNSIIKNKDLWNQICAVVDRIDDSVKFINSNDNYPITPNNFILFLVYTDFIKSGIYKLFEKIYLTKPTTVEESLCFRNVCLFNTPYFSENTHPTDDSFFEYLRSICYAHPFDTNRYKKNEKNRPFMNEGEYQYSPWLTCPVIFSTFKDSVGIRIYSTDDEKDGKILNFSFDNLKEYVSRRYNLLDNLIKWSNNTIKNQREKLMLRKINKNGSVVDILDDVINVLKERMKPTFDIELGKDFLTCDLSDKSNQKQVDFYRKYLISNISDLCTACDTLEYEKAEGFFDMLYATSKNIPGECNYQLEKIHSYVYGDRPMYIEKGSNLEWGLIQAEEFYRCYGKKFVKMDIKNMPLIEIRLLVQVACFMGFAVDYKLISKNDLKVMLQK